MDTPLCKPSNNGEWENLTSTVANIHKSIDTFEHPSCPRPCSKVETTVGMPFTDSTTPIPPKASFMRMYFGPEIGVKRIVTDYTWLSMYAEIGGYTGLLLGLSFFSLFSVSDRMLEISKVEERGQDKTLIKRILKF